MCLEINAVEPGMKCGSPNDSSAAQSAWRRAGPLLQTPRAKQLAKLSSSTKQLLLIKGSMYGVSLLFFNYRKMETSMPDIINLRRDETVYLNINRFHLNFARLVFATQLTF